MNHHITTQIIDVLQLIQEAHHPKAGAIVLFSGEVRNHNLGKGVDYLEYESHETLANKVIADIVAEAHKKWELHGVVCQHRIGKVPISESAICVITLSSHRGAAYEANRYVVDRVKYEAPIWKREFFADGTEAWGHNSDGSETPNSTVSND
ncbi:MAG: molybdenum cofactor biosynthesis protein MoaE [Chitinophagales bacterium]